MGKFKDIDKKINEIYRQKYEDIWQLNYHFETLFGLINDPNGLCYFNGEYYIFYQWNPLGVVHKNKCWGLVKTKNFINYSIPKLVLKPEDYYDKDGVYSGSAIVANEKINLLYTGNVKDENNNRMSYQCLAYCDKDGNTQKYGPVVKELPKGYTAHFRDPKVFKKDDTYYFIIGAQTEDLKGRAVLYKSSDLENWQFAGEIDTEYKDFGFMWECPNLLNIDNKDILIFSPQGLEKEEYRYQNIYQSGYIIGNLDYDNLKFNHNEFKELDFGTDFYAPQVFKDDKGRDIMIGWMGMPEEEEYHKTTSSGRVHCLTMPRELSLRDGYVYQQPIEEMKKLRNRVMDSAENICVYKWENKSIKQNSYELYLKLNKKESNKLNIKLAASQESDVEISIDFENNEIVYKNNLDKKEAAVRKLKCEDIEREIKLQIFMDKSALEIYINEGKYVLSNRIYPKENNTEIKICSDEGNTFEIIDMKMWSLGGFSYDE